MRGHPHPFHRHTLQKNNVNGRFYGHAVDENGKKQVSCAQREFLLSELSRSDKILAEKTVCVLLVRGEDPDGNPIYAYVGVRADKLQSFMEAQSRGLFYPEEHGVVIESGTGIPDPEVRARMERDYGFNHEGMLDIPSAEQANQVAAELSRIAKHRDKLDD